MRALTEGELRDAFVNAGDDELTLMSPPHDFVLTDWDHQDFLGWEDPRHRGRGYLIVERDGEPTGILLRAAGASARGRASMCNLCHTVQPADQVTLYTARKAGEAGQQGASVGTYICRDLSCHDNVRIAAPLAPSEVRASVDARIDGTRRRTEAFVESVAVVPDA